MLSALTFSILMTVCIIAIHYWSLRAITVVSSKVKSHFYMSMTVVVSLFLVHLAEIGFYSFHLYLFHEVFTLAGFSENEPQDFVSYFHLAGTSYTTLGISQYTPVDKLAIVLDIASLTGFMMLTWSATYLYNIYTKTHSIED